MPLIQSIRLRLIRYSITALIGAGFGVVSSEAQDDGYPIVSSYSATEIGADAMGWTIKQGPDGVLYFGCNTLVSFDAERWHSTAINGAYALRGLDFGADGRLWVGSAGEIGWFESTKNSTYTFHSLRSHLPRDNAIVGEIWYAAANGEGAVFVSEDKIYQWDGKVFQIWSMPGMRRLSAMSSGGITYVHHVPTGLYAIGPKGPQKIISADVLGNAAVVWMEPRADGWLLATVKGLYTYARGKLEVYAPEASAFVRRQSLICAVRLPDGRLALGTYLGGVAFVRPDGSLEKTLSEKDGLPTHAIYSLGVDREGGLWATSNSHIFRLATNSASTLFDQRAALPPQAIHRIVRQEGQITVATDNGIYGLSAETRSFQPRYEVSEWISDMRLTPEGLIVAGKSAVKRITRDSTEVIYATKKDAYLAIPSRFFPGCLLVSEARNIVLIGTGHQPRVLVHDLPDIATSIAEDSQGRLWLGTSTRGVLVAQPNESSPVTALQPQPVKGLVRPNESCIVAATNDGTVILLTQEGGWTMDHDSRHFDPIVDYPKREISAASLVSSDDVMWLAYPATENSSACVGRLTIQDGQGIWQPHSIEGLDRIGTPQSIYSELAGSKGTVVWIGGTNGILRNEVHKGPKAPQPELPLLHCFVRSEENNSLSAITQALPYSTHSIVFEFAEPEFALRSSLRLETRIDGIDERWVPADSTSRRELTAVRDGRYIFHVRAVASTGAVSETTSFKFEVMPPWWRSTPAIVGALLALLPLGYGAYFLRVRALRRQNAELEKKVGQRTEQLAQASAAKTQFVANMSHDIRNPLNGIVGLALALEDTKLDPKQQELVATLRECTAYLSTLVDDVLDFASIEAGRVELRPGPFTPAELLRSVVATLRADTAESGAVLTVETDPRLPASLLGDAGRIQQILVNYVTNALKYAGGNIRLTATAPADAQGEVEFAVADEGAGITEAEQTALFTKFSRLPSAQNSGITGSGLGLASCRLLADIMGGSVGVTSRPGQGTRFYLRLPLTAASAPVVVPSGELPNTTVLVVEDADYNAWAATAVLAKLGLACERARDGREAIRLFAEKRFNLVLLDRNLPDMDGTEVARQIRSMEEDGPRAILLAVTAYCTPQDRALCLEAGMDAFVGKPLTPEKLRKILIAAGRRLLTAASMHVSPRAAAATPLVDMSLLDYISDGTDAGLDEQIERFLAALAEGEARLAQASRSRDYTTLGDAAHYLLSQAKLVGSTPLVEAAVSLERAARAKDGFAFGELLLRVHREVRSVTAAMRRYHPAGQSA